MKARASRLLAGLAACWLPACAGGVSSGSSAGPTAAATPSPTTASARSSNMTLEAHLDLAALTSTAHAHHDEPIDLGGAAMSGSGNWGYTSPDGRRFALTGTSMGLSVVEVTTPSQPRNPTLIVGPENQWREVKTFGTYAYVTTEARHGLDIVDLSNPERPEKVQTWSETFSSAHTVWADADRGLLFVNGTRNAQGLATGMRVLSLLPDPAHPREVGSFQGFYVHDSYTRGNLLFASAINDGFLAVLDVSDPANIRELMRFFTGGRFTHNSWLTGDGRYLFTTDERGGRPLEGWDLLNMATPRKVSEYIALAGSIPHNVMIDGARLLVSHYTEGVHLLDVADPERPRVLGFYDTYDGPSTGFAGDWGAYIFPGSDLIVASDINGGLFVVRYTGR